MLLWLILLWARVRDVYKRQILKCCQLVNAAEGRAVLAGDHLCTDAPGIDGCALGFQTADQVFVQVAGGRDDSIMETGSIQHFFSFLGKICQVTAVQADSVAL